MVPIVVGLNGPTVTRAKCRIDRIVKTLPTSPNTSHALRLRKQWLENAVRKTVRFNIVYG